MGRLVASLAVGLAAPLGRGDEVRGYWDASAATGGRHCTEVRSNKNKWVEKKTPIDYIEESLVCHQAYGHRELSC